jgi:hypothetical protein
MFDMPSAFTTCTVPPSIPSPVHAGPAGRPVQDLRGSVPFAMFHDSTFYGPRGPHRLRRKPRDASDGAGGDGTA